MALNYIWIAFFLIAFVVALAKLIFLGDTSVFPDIVESLFSAAKTGFEVSLGLTGILTFFLGIMRVGEKAGIIQVFSKLTGPFFRRLMPEIPKGHTAHGSILLNLTANMLGLDNAATPAGLRAMEEMQELNPDKKKASNAQIMFLVLNTSGLTLIPITIMAYRTQFGAADPSDIFIPILLATFFSTLAGLIAVSIYQKIKLFDPVILAYLSGMTLFVVGLIYYFSTLEKEQITLISQVASNLILFSIIAGFIFMGWIKKINVYEEFISGAKDGFKIAVKIIPYLVAILVAIAAFRSSGALDYLTNVIRNFVAFLGVNTDFVDALPTAFIKPLSGSGARGMMLESLDHFGVDSFVGRLTSIMQGATDTTFYIIAVYFGSVGIRNTRYAVVCGLIADFVGIIAAIFIGYLFFY